MLEYALRLSALGLSAARRPRLSLMDESVLKLRVWPTDIDVYGHMNNGRYLTVMDLGRTDLALRTGLFRLWMERRWKPLLGSATIRYRRSLTPLRRYQLHTRLLCWDDKWFFFEQRFRRHGELHAVAMAKGLVRGSQGNVPPQELFSTLGGPAESPPLTETVHSWLALERALGRTGE